MILSLQSSSMEHLTLQNFCPNCREIRWILPYPEAHWPVQAVKGHCRTRKCLSKVQSLLHVYFYPHELSLFTIKLGENFYFWGNDAGDILDRFISFCICTCLIILFLSQCNGFKKNGQCNCFICLIACKIKQLSGS